MGRYEVAVSAVFLDSMAAAVLVEEMDNKLVVCTVKQRCLDVVDPDGIHISDPQYACRGAGLQVEAEAGFVSRKVRMVGEEGHDVDSALAVAASSVECLH